MLLLIFSSFSSRTMKMRSNLDRRVSYIWIFCEGVRRVMYSPYTGFAAAKTEHLAFKVIWIPALAIETVCYSITSCIATRSSKPILSNSSMHITPLSANTIAPASSLLSPVSLSWIIAAVSPTPVEPLPVEFMQSGAREFIRRRN